mgnify:CR=1 FL=1
MVILGGNGDGTFTMKNQYTVGKTPFVAAELARLA